MRYFISCLYFLPLVYKYILVCDVFVASLAMLDSTYFVTLDACLMYKWFAGGMFMLMKHIFRLEMQCYSLTQG